MLELQQLKVMAPNSSLEFIVPFLLSFHKLELYFSNLYYSISAIHL